MSGFYKTTPKNIYVKILRKQSRGIQLQYIRIYTEQEFRVTIFKKKYIVNVNSQHSQGKFIFLLLFL